MTSPTIGLTDILKFGKDLAVALWGPVRLELARRNTDEMLDVVFATVEPQLDEALDMLAGTTSMTKLPLQKVRSALSQPSELFSIIAVREWVDAPANRRLLKQIVRSFLAGQEPAPADIQALVDAYVERTYDHPRRALDAIAAVQKFMARSIGRYLSPGESVLFEQAAGQARLVRSDLADLNTGMAAGFASLGDRMEALSTTAIDVYPPVVADKELRAETPRILSRRYFPGVDHGAELKALAERAEKGDLRRGSAALRAVPMRRLVRRLAIDNETAEAERWLRSAKAIDEGADDTVEQAYIAAAAGDVSRAIGMHLRGRDPEHLAALLAILRHYRSPADARSWMMDDGLRPDQVSATGVAIACLLHLDAGDWHEAERWTSGLSVDQRLEVPALLALSGAAAVCLAVPEDLRASLYARGLVPFFDVHDVPFYDDDASKSRLERAHRDFTEVAEAASALGAQEAGAYYADRALWVAFQIAHMRNAAIETVTQSMRSDDLVFRHLRFALSYNIPFNREAVAQEIAQLEKLDATTDDSVAADFVLAVHDLRATPAALAAHIERKRNLYLRHGISAEALASMEIEALARARRNPMAREAMEKYRHLFGDPPTLQSLEGLVAEAEGADAVTVRKATYESSGRRLPDLWPLVEALQERRDWKGLLPYALELYRHEKTIASAELVYRCCRESRDDDALSEFLVEVSELVDRSPRLKSALAWDHYLNGRFGESRLVNDELRRSRIDDDDRNLAVNLAVESGDWDALHALVEEAWGRRAEMSAADLMAMASLAADIDNPRMMPMAELAVEKAPDDANIHLSGWLLAHQSGKLATHPTAAGWFQTAVARSDGEGPVRAVSLRELADDQPRRMEANRPLWSGIRDATLPLFLVAERLHVPWSRMLAGAAIGNASETDPRRRTVIHAFDGGRGRVDLRGVKRLGLDFSALLVLGHIGLLDRVVAQFDRIVVPGGVLSQLFGDRRQLRFRQPAIVAEATELQALLADGRLLRMAAPAPADVTLAEEVGVELAELVATAARDGGVVVVPAPVHKLSSFMEETADLSAQQPLLTDSHAVLGALVAAGELDGRARERAAAYLGQQDKGWPDAAAIDHGKPVYLTSLAITYFATVGLLKPLARLGRVFVSRAADSHAKAQIAAAGQEPGLNALIENVRAVVASGLEAGRIVSGPRRRIDDADGASMSTPTMFIEQALASMDALAIDDRALNKHAFWKSRTSDVVVPIVMTLDLIDHLEEVGIVGPSERDGYRYQLRRSGFSCVPVDADELSRLVAAAETGDRFSETAELRAIRNSVEQWVAWRTIRFPEEFRAVQSLHVAVVQAIRKLWREHGAATPHRQSVPWLLTLLPVPLAMTGRDEQGTMLPPLLHLQASAIALLATPLLGSAIIDDYARWVDAAVIAPAARRDPGLPARLLPYVEQFAVALDGIEEPS